MREKVGKSRNNVFFQWFVAPEGRKVGSLKRRVRSQLARGAMKNCTPLWREFPSQNVQNTPCSDHFSKLRCQKSARRCGAKRISKSKVSKNGGLGPLLEVAMSKKCTPLWREAHFEVKMYKTHHVRTIFGGSRCRKSVRRCGAKHISKSKCTKHTMYGPFLEVQMSKKCTPLWREAHFEVKMYKAHHVRTIFGGSDVASLRFASLHHTTLHSTTLHDTTLHYITLHYTTLHYTPLHYITLHYITLNDTAPQIDR